MGRDSAVVCRLSRRQDASLRDTTPFRGNEGDKLTQRGVVGGFLASSSRM